MTIAVPLLLPLLFEAELNPTISYSTTYDTDSLLQSVIEYVKEELVPYLVNGTGQWELVQQQQQITLSP